MDSGTPSAPSRGEHLRGLAVRESGRFQRGPSTFPPTKAAFSRLSDASNAQRVRATFDASIPTLVLASTTRGCAISRPRRRRFIGCRQRSQYGGGGIHNLDATVPRTTVHAYVFVHSSVSLAGWPTSLPEYRLRGGKGRPERGSESERGSPAASGRTSSPREPAAHGVAKASSSAGRGVPGAEGKDPGRQRPNRRGSLFREEAAQAGGAATLTEGGRLRRRMSRPRVLPPGADASWFTRDEVGFCAFAPRHRGDIARHTKRPGATR